MTQAICDDVDSSLTNDIGGLCMQCTMAHLCSSAPNFRFVGAVGFLSQLILRYPICVRVFKAQD